MDKRSFYRSDSSVCIFVCLCSKKSNKGLNLGYIYCTMTNFTGFCSFPHGGYISAGLFIATAAALVASVCAVVSCRLVILSYTSQTGNFEQSFSLTYRVHTSSVPYKTAVGLFTWLRPNGNFTYWDDGTCVGYQTSMKQGFTDTAFEFARGSGSVAVLLSIVIVIWSIVGSCLAWNKWQIMILAGLSLFAAIASGLGFMIFRSNLCHSEFSDSSCSMGEGGLVLVAAVILWVTSFLIIVLFLRTLDQRISDPTLSDVERSKAQQLAETEKSNCFQFKNHSDDPQDEVYDEQGKTPTTDGSNSFDTESQIQETSADTGDEKEPISMGIDHEDEYEVYINNRGQRVDEILKDLQKSEVQLDKRQR